MSTCDLRHGDCREVLTDLPENAIVLTDPPYGIGYRVNDRRGRKGLKTTKAFDTAARGAIVGDDGARERRQPRRCRKRLKHPARRLPAIIPEAMRGHAGKWVFCVMARRVPNWQLVTGRHHLR